MANVFNVEDIMTGRTMGDVRREELVRWIVAKRDTFEKERDRSGNTDKMSREYFLWRGKYHEMLKSPRDSEWSKLIHPATAAAIDSHVAEVESATINGDYFMALTDDDENPNIQRLEKQLKSDLSHEKAKIRDSLSAMILMGAIFGEAAGEIYLDEINELETYLDPRTGRKKIRKGPARKIVRLRPLMPNQFFYDPNAPAFEDSMCHGIRYYTPAHTVRAKQAEGVYRDDVEVQTTEVKDRYLMALDESLTYNTEVTELTKWNGLVPRDLLPGKGDDEMESDPDDPERKRVLEYDENDLVEAVVVIMNSNEVLMEEKNPTWLGDRMFLFYRQERIPGSLRGRGTAEKGDNTQRGLDANYRAQMEASALVVHPLLAVNQQLTGTRGFTLKRRPGSTMVVNGDPRLAISRIDLGNVDPSVFANTEKLEQLHAQATATFDQSTMNSTASIAQQGGGTMVTTSFVKMAQRSVRNFNTDVIEPLVNISARLYMQFEPDLYEAEDVTFRATGVMGALAKEIEQAHALNIMKTIQSGTLEWWVMYRKVLENSNSDNSEQMIALADQKIQALMNPQPDPMQELQIQQIQATINNQNQDSITQRMRAFAEIARIANDMASSDSDEAKTHSEILLNIAKAEAEEAGQQLELYRASMEQMVSQANTKRAESGVTPDDEIQLARQIAFTGTGGNPGQ